MLSNYGYSFSLNEGVSSHTSRYRSKGSNRLHTITKSVANPIHSFAENISEFMSPQKRREKLSSPTKMRKK